MNSVDILAKSKVKSVWVPYLNLCEKLTAFSKIDPLKCDIEGSELALLGSTLELFANVRHAVFELHDYNCDTAKCRSILQRLGFIHRQTIRSVPGSFARALFGFSRMSMSHTVFLGHFSRSSRASWLIFKLDSSK